MTRDASARLPVSRSLCCPPQRLGRESAALSQELDHVQGSVTSLIDKRESLESERHAMLMACLGQVNDALGNMFRRLTCPEGERRPCMSDELVARRGGGAEEARHLEF